MKNRTNKILAVALAVTLLALAVVVGTMAYLVDTEDNTVTNTFTVGANVSIDLYETANGDGTGGEVLARSIKYVAGAGNTPKDPTLRVNKTSETCWVFVEVVADDEYVVNSASGHASAYITYQMADGWTLVDGATGLNSGVVYAYETKMAPTDKEANPSGNDMVLPVLKENKVFFENRSGNLPAQQTLSFTGYAIQADVFDDYDTAWASLYGQVKKP